MNRPDLYVVARFLERLWPGGRMEVELTRSKLQAATRLNYDLFVRYLDFLRERGLVVLLPPGPDGLERIRITEAGKATHARLVGWILDVVRPPRL